MKNLLFLFSFLFLGNLHAQQKHNTVVVLDAQKIGFYNEVENQIKALKSEGISTVTVLKDTTITKGYGSDHGVIIITTKKYILNTFFRDFIEKSTLKEKIKTPDDLKIIGVVTDKPNSKNKPYDELSKYIFTNTITEKIKKVVSIIYIKPKDAVKINPDWINGAIEISSE
ncbi:hypothetical protein [Flavobacterium sp.]|uniref:hypothetical protein n=1 Tax=Flavobacterium sp. TaxID=239 RepID=UPI0025FFD9EF|nr:hypothetical protein [Flavobacterium sp.]